MTPTLPALTQMSEEELDKLEQQVIKVGPEIGQPSLDRITLIYALLEHAPALIAELRRHRSAAQVPGDGMDAPVGLVSALMRFYNVETVADLIVAQDEHIKKLQEKLPKPSDGQFPRKVREG